MKNKSASQQTCLRTTILLALLFCLQKGFSQNTPILIKNGTYSIPLDYETGFVSDYIQIFKVQGVDYLAMGYRMERKINVYDYKKRQLKKVIKYQMEGPDGVGSEIPAFFIENFNSIYIYSYWERTIYLTNSEGKVRDKFKIPDNAGYPIVEPGTMCPMIKVGRYLYLSGLLLGTSSLSSTEKPLLKIDFEKKTIKTLGVSPANAKKWNYYRKNAAKYDFVTGKNFFVIGYDMSDSLYLVSGSLEHRFLAKSKFLKEILPLSKNKNYIASKDEKNAFLASDSYWGVKYDPFQKLYYRFAIKGRSMKEIYEYKPAEMTVIVLDDNLKKLGEIELPYNSYIDMSFVTERGLHIANKKLYNEVSEDVLTFDVYKVNR